MTSCRRKHSGVGVTDDICCRVAVVADHRIGAVSRHNGHHRADRHHVTARVTRPQVADIFGLLAKWRVGLGHNPVDAAELVEVVDVGRAKIDLQRFEQVGQRDALGLRFDPIDLDLELRNVGLIGADRVRHARRSGDLGHEYVQRVLQCAMTEARPILEVQRIARSIAKPLNGWRKQRVRKSLLDARKLGIEFGSDLRGAAATLVERLEQDIGCRDVRRIHELQCIEPGIGIDEIHTLDGASDFVHPSRDRLCTGERRTLGQFCTGEQVELVLRRDKAARHRLKQHNRDRQKTCIDRERNTTPAERSAHHSLIAPVR